VFFIFLLFTTLYAFKLPALNSPKAIIISHTIYKNFNYQIFTTFIKEQISSPAFIRDSIYIPIVVIYLLNEYLNYQDKDKDLKINSLSNKNTYKLKRLIKQIVLIFNIMFIKDIESVT